MLHSRRRFLTIAAAASVAGLPARAASVTRWQGVALGANASIHLAHPEADRIIAKALAEIARLEQVFSLHRPDSALVKLNAAGHLAAPPFELLDCLGICAAVHTASGGAFDATVQPLWALHARSYAKGHAPREAEIMATLPLVGWDAVQISAAEINFTRPGMALTLNGVAQGVIADRVADLLAREGLSDILVNAGEFRALGGHPNGGSWPIRLDDTGKTPVPLRNRALASSGPLGTVFDEAGRAGHILDPRTGHPSATKWKLISVTDPRAGLADALSTAACLLSRTEVDRMMAVFPTAELVGLS
ncbi:FAD:protein FMN transferase [Roseinatronobacter bogoriensis]|uniref:FAD:protein FMN transferase n=1 Tax=Roseinatronobacter bogoriensis subsp. barguzinensis TaxID=441209 RepID=A0A2K8KCE6_9RHOB|nr:MULTISPECIES: FAD:protein FMN transferase [Rhodobaca]ATX65593.1 FAD:protein FMN transferase [Rhodobaca barguzinensis]MBB4208478.1 thiamine biosynthesis lipoprotein [Rhodobaca bogoriensis DSM 18756]TDW39117.1 thiamine biosynthesis lipoprotein [Rhodobaca barguzinensis]TDY66437.1 thiamine biosynthesis lipoprotein [Rhodobaca bogoriensis DSM 18756]